MLNPNFSIVIPGEPISKARPRFCRQGNFVKTYDIQDDKKKWLKTLFKLAMANKWGWGNGIPLLLKIDCYFKPPNSFSKKQLNLMSWGQLHHTSKPDGSNLLKMYEDTMNEIVFNDDRQLISVTVNKFYSNESKTVITIMPKITYDEAINQFMQIINFDEFCALSSDVYDFAYTLKERHDMAEKEKMDLTKNALMKLGMLADRHGKMLLESAKKYKSLINEIENSPDQNCSA